MMSWMAEINDLLSSKGHRLGEEIVLKAIHVGVDEGPEGGGYTTSA